MGSFSRLPSYFPVSMAPKMMEPSGLSLPRRSRLKALLWVKPCVFRLSIKKEYWGLPAR